MRKFKLDVEELTVESFATDAAVGALGTVRAHAHTDDACVGPGPVSAGCSANPYTECQSCYLSCIDSCNSCQITMCRTTCGG